MSGPILFISDLHLSESHPEITHAFERFIDEHALHASALYILGDFFEAWVGDDDNSEFIRHIKGLLKRLTDAGVAVYFMRGNRDFFLGKRFCHETGMKFLPDPTLVEINGERILLTHGDYLCTDDIAHQKFRRRADNKYWRAAFLTLPLPFRRWAAVKAREKSQARYNRQNAVIANQDSVIASRDSVIASPRSNPPNITDVNETTVTKWLKKHNTLKIIHGHTHRPAVHEINLNGKHAQRIVLSAWDESYYYFQLTNQ